MKKANTILALFTFISCCVSAFCLSLMIYTFINGELPFDISPLMPKVEAQNKSEDTTALEEAKKEEAKRTRQDEEYAMSLYKDLQEERDRLSRREKELADHEKRLRAIERNLIVLQDAVRSEAQDIKVSLESIDAKEISNLQDQAQILSEIEPKAGAQLVLSWAQDAKKNDLKGNLAPRVLYFMEKGKTAALFASVLKENDAQKTKLIKEISDEMRRLTPETVKE